MDFLPSQLLRLESDMFYLSVCVCVWVCFGTFYYDSMWSDKPSWVLLQQADLTCIDLQQADRTFCLAPQTQMTSLLAWPAFFCDFWTLMQTLYLPRGWFNKLASLNSEWVSPFRLTYILFHNVARENRDWAPASKSRSCSTICSSDIRMVWIRSHQPSPTYLLIWLLQ